MDFFMGLLALFVAAQLRFVASLPSLSRGYPPLLRSEQGGLPDNLDDWEQQMHKLDAEETPLNSSFGIKIAYGILSSPGDARVRSIIRDTWMKKPGICAGGQGSSALCTVNVFFVVGSANKGYVMAELNNTAEILEKINLDGDVLDVPALDGQDYEHKSMNLLTLKLFLWLFYASENFKWATHVVKSDTDYFPHFYRTLPLIQAQGVSADSYQYFGKHIVSHNCSYDMAAIESTATTVTERYCVYGHSEYFSRLLAQRLTRDDFREYWTANEVEDRDVGVAVTNLVRKTHIHVATLDERTSSTAWPEVGL